MQAANEFKYLLVLDFEATCQKDVKLTPCSEIIQFPTLVIDLASNQVLPARFHHYIRPEFNPKLTPFCTELTGITQDTVDKGIKLAEALTAFDQFIAKNELKDFVILTCGDWDLKTCLATEAKHKGLKLADYFERWINIKLTFPSVLKGRVSGMTDMLDVLGLPLVGKHHSGIDDCLNIATVVRTLIREHGWRALRKMVRQTRKR